MNNAATQLVASFNVPSVLLRRALLTDAALTFMSGVVLAFAASPLAALFALPVAALRGAGLIFIPFAAFTAWLGTRQRVHRALVFVVIAANVLWSLDTVLLLFSGWVQTNLLGEIFVVGNALIIVALAEAEFLGLRRSTLVEPYAWR
jgi:hypothetical protein